MATGFQTHLCLLLLRRVTPWCTRQPVPSTCVVRWRGSERRRAGAAAGAQRSAGACMLPGERRAGPADPDDRCPPSTEAAQRRSPTRTLSLLLAYSHRGYVPALRTGAARAPEGRGRVLAARCSVTS